MTYKVRTSESIKEQKIARRLAYITKLIDSLADSENIGLSDSSQLYSVNLLLCEMQKKYDHGRY